MIFPLGDAKYSSSLLQNELDRLDSSHENPLSMEIIKQWLSENWEYYRMSSNLTWNELGSGIANCRRSKVIDSESQFTRVYKELYNLERYHGMDSTFGTEINRYMAIKDSPKQLEAWFIPIFETHWDYLSIFDIELWPDRIYISQHGHIHVFLHGFENCLELGKICHQLFYKEKLLDNLETYKRPEPEIFSNDLYKEQEKEKIRNMERLFPNLFERKYKSHRMGDDKYPNIEIGSD